ncbi:4Fe-4S dicluster domain-containing protein [Fodinicola feengrottensis]|uniref:4Fe-4S dicluster domain-containing protein n=1 Tax=Fodinicola feengrottensis TaxID=435914 RepID=UPI002440F9E9|nr:4Fe-4S dicluster domain-containing protein [Fodinicola feengrottensis]
MAAFDDHRPPSRELVDDCVHCGFCLPTCPTYVLWGHESDSPRGRIDLINTGLSGGPMTDTMVTHVDRCLGCMACVTACPSGVQYDKIVTNTRAQIERRHQRTRRRETAARTDLRDFSLSQAVACPAAGPDGIPADRSAPAGPAHRPAGEAAHWAARDGIHRPAAGPPPRASRPASRHAARNARSSR